MGQPLHKQLRASCEHAGFAKEMLRYPSRSHVAFRWVKGHVLDKVADRMEILDDGARRDAVGNGIADTFTNIARDLHPQPEPWLAKKVRGDISDVTAIPKYAVKVALSAPEPRRASGGTEGVAAKEGNGLPQPAPLGASGRALAVHGLHVHGALRRFGGMAKERSVSWRGSARCWPTPRGTTWPLNPSSMARACCASRVGHGAPFAPGSCASAVVVAQGARRLAMPPSNALGKGTSMLTVET